MLLAFYLLTLQPKDALDLGITAYQATYYVYTDNDALEREIEAERSHS